MLIGDIRARFDPKGCKLLIEGGKEQDINSTVLRQALELAEVDMSHVKTVSLNGFARVIVDAHFPQLMNAERLQGNVVLQARVDIGRIMPALRVIEGNLTLHESACADLIDEVTGMLELHRESSTMAVRHVGGLDAGGDANIPRLRSVRTSLSMRFCTAPELRVVGEFANLIDPLQAPKLAVVGRGADWFFFQGKPHQNQSGYDGRPSGVDLATSMVKTLREQDRLLATASEAIAASNTANGDCHRPIDGLGL